MPHFIRRRHGLDWFTPGELAHLPIQIRKRLIETARQNVEQDKLNRKMARIFGYWFLGTWLLTCGSIPFLALGDFLGLISQPVSDFLFPSLIWLGFGLFGLMMVFGVPFTIVLKYKLYRRHVRELMLTEGIRPALCFDCRYYVEGFEGDQCPNCGAMLVTPGSLPPVESVDGSQSR